MQVVLPGTSPDKDGPPPWLWENRRAPEASVRGAREISELGGINRAWEIERKGDLKRKGNGAMRGYFAHAHLPPLFLAQFIRPQDNIQQLRPF